ncbi:MAG: c-type cytochrome biogenesis protein CcmI, partial [Gammaproteobacteria bacterium]
MTIFMVVAALLLVAALLFVIPPLLQKRRSADVVARSAINITVYRDQLAELERDLENDIISQEQYEVGRVELERRLLEDVEAAPSAAAAGGGNLAAAKKTALLLGILLPLFAVGGYFYFGEPDAIDPQQAAQEQMSQMSESDVTEQINRMVAQLAQRLKEDPLDAEGWKMLGRSYIVLQRFDDALAALENAVRLNDGDAQLLADYADALAMAQDLRVVIIKLADRL